MTSKNIGPGVVLRKQKPAKELCPDCENKYDQVTELAALTERVEQLEIFMRTLIERTRNKYL